MGRRKTNANDEEPWRAVLVDDDSGLADIDTDELHAAPEEKFYALPSGQTVRCRGEEEYTATVLNAKPYIDIADQVGPESWPHIRAFLQNLLLLDTIQREISDPRTIRAAPAAQKELRTMLTSVQNQINQFAKIDPLRLARGDEEQTTAEWRKGVMIRALEYAESHIGEFTWLATCPSMTCPHHKTPFPMILEVPHFAFDPAAGPGVIWNQEIMEMVHLGYCRDSACGHSAHDKPHEGRLSVRDAARILRISAIGILAICDERGFSLGIEYDLDQPDTLVPFV